MADLVSKYPSFRIVINQARNAGYTDEQIEQWLLTKHTGQLSDNTNNPLSALGQFLRPKESDWLPAPLSILANASEAPQVALTSAIGDIFDLGPKPEASFSQRLAEGQMPSDLMPESIRNNPIAKFVSDVVLDPLNLIGVGAFTKGKKLARAAGELGQAANKAFGQPVDIARAVGRSSDELKGALRTGNVEVVGEAPDIERAVDGLGAGFGPQFQPAEILNEAMEKVVRGNQQTYNTIGDAFMDMASSRQIPIVEDRPLVYQMLDAMNQGLLDPVEILETVGRRGISPEKAANDLRKILTGVSESARTMAWQRHQKDKLLGRIRESYDKNPTVRSIMDQAFGRPTIDTEVAKLGLWKRMDNVRRGLLVTQFATAARNFISQTGRLALYAVERPLDNFLGSTLGKLNTAGRKMDWSESLEGVHAITNTLREMGRSFWSIRKQVIDPSKADGEIDKLLRNFFPKEWDRMFGSFSSDIRSAGKFAGVAEKTVDMLNTFNRFQEFSMRRGIFEAALHTAVKKRTGQELKDIIATNAHHLIKKDDIAQAVDKALELTWAQSPAFGTFGQKFVGMVNAIPGATLLLPFPRFMVNSAKFFFDFSPFGFTRLLRKQDWALALQGKNINKFMSRPILGSVMLGVADQIRNSEYAGEKWNEIKVGDKIIDVRPYNPFAAYLFVSDIIKRSREGTLKSLTARDVAMGILSTNLRAGTGLYLLDAALQGMSGFGDSEKLLRRIQEFGGEAVGGFFTPLQQIKDVLDEFSAYPPVVRDRRANALLGPTISRIPGFAETLPPLESATRAEDIPIVSPGIRQVTGFSFRPEKNVAEAELDRLGFEYREIIPSTGDPTANRLIARHMGPLVEEYLPRIINNDRYRRANDTAKAEILRRQLNRLRQAARRRAAVDDPIRFDKLRMQRRPVRYRRALQSGGLQSL